MKLHGEHATLVFHSCVFGTAKIDVSRFWIREIEPSDKHDKAVRVDYIRPKQKTAYGATFTPDSHRFLIVERDEGVLYDSRNDVPIDMRASKRSAPSLWCRDEGNADVSVGPGTGAHEGKTCRAD